MLDQDRSDLLRRLSDAHGVSGFEDDVQQAIHGLMPSSCHVQRDRIGNLIASLTGRSAQPNILIEAHVDEIGFLVARVTRQGYLRFRAIGTWSPLVLLGQRVVVKGRFGDVAGVIGSQPPHAASKVAPVEPRIDDMFIDIGATDAREVAAMGVRPGLPIVPSGLSEVTANGNGLIGKAWDNRAGVALLIATLHELAQAGDHPNTVTAAATVQEELGSRGMKALALQVKPDVAFVLEGILATDDPQARADEEGGSALGKGPNLVFHDDSMLANPRLLEWCTDIAEEAGIPHQRTPAFGSNNAGEVHIQSGGIPTLVFGVPCRYIHAPNGLLLLDDFRHAVELLTLLVRRLDDATLGRITDV